MNKPYIQREDKAAVPQSAEDDGRVLFESGAHKRLSYEGMLLARTAFLQAWRHWLVDGMPFPFEADDEVVGLINTLRADAQRLPRGGNDHGR